MNTATHSVAPEDVMAYLDGELSQAEAEATAAHLEHCVECAGLAERLRATSQSLSGWTIPPVPPSVEASVMNCVNKTARGSLAAKPARSIELSFWNWRLWAVGAGGAVSVALIFVAVAASVMYYEDHPRPAAPVAMNEMATGQAATGDAKPQQMASLAGLEQTQAAIAGANEAEVRPPSAGNAGIVPSPSEAPAAPGPMIARTVSLAIVVKDIAASRATLEAILARHHGYSAQLTAASAENAPRSIQASLRIPAQELAASIGELKALGRVQNESQSGEEVTQQHTDLAARLRNSRETEERLRAILQQRTGKIEDVLAVEQEIARVRGEIETMEADLQALEHRVEFASVDLQLMEEYRAQFNQPSTSVSSRLSNAFVSGLRNVAGTVLGVALFLEEYGPVTLLWLAILGVPALLLIRRYRRVAARL